MRNGAKDELLKPVSDAPDNAADGSEADYRIARLPPLNLFRVFDAAARHRSFRHAAEELFVTPSAVSQQIRQLEEILQVRLFRRLPRQVELTREGTILADVVQEALVMLSRGCSRLLDPATPTLLCVNTTTAFASRWMVNHLKNFMAEYPGIKVTLLASSDPVDFKRQDIDAAVRWGSNNWKSDLFAELLTKDFLFPVCSPGYREEKKLDAPEALARATLLHEVHGSAWASWFEEAACKPVEFRDVLYFSDAALMLEAAVQGQGVCLTNYLLAEKDLAAGRLVKPFEHVLELRRDGYYFLTRAEAVDKPAIASLRSWLRREAATTVGAHSG